MKLRAGILGAWCLVCVPVVLAQAPPAVPRPGPEHKRLQYFVGRWRGSAELKPSPFGPGGKMTSVDVGEMFPGDFFLVFHSQAKGPRGNVRSLAVAGYDSEEKVYTYKIFDSSGEDETFKGVVEGNLWTWTSESRIDSKLVKSRFRIKEVSPTSYTYNFDVSVDGGPWTETLKGKATKTP